MTISILLILLFLFTVSYLIYKNFPIFKKHKYTILLISFFLWLVINIIIHPKNAVEAANNGVKTWFYIVLPSLLPFFIISEILIGLGVVRFIGTLLKPIMRPVFNVPGEGIFPFAMSIISGYPVGASLAAKLRKEKVVTKTEAQRLVSFCSTSGPLFMIGAVSVGMFNNTKIGPLIAVSHYLGSITVGILFRFYRYGETKTKVNVTTDNTSLRKAFDELIKARKKDGRNIGMLMGDSVRQGFNTMLLVGGFIILYSVIIEILTITNVFKLFSSFLGFFAPDLDGSIIHGLLSGIIEITNGCKIISEIDSSNMIVKLVAVSFLIGWSGFSIHSQAASIISKTDINIKKYIYAKLFHGVFSSIYTYLLLVFILKDYVISSFSTNYSVNNINLQLNWLSTLKFSIKFQLLIVITIIIIGLVISFLNNMKRLFKNSFNIN